MSIRDDEEDDDRPRRPRRDDDRPRRPARDASPPGKSRVGLILGIVGGVLLLLCGGGVALVYMTVTRVTDRVKEVAMKAPNGPRNLGESQETQGQLGTVGLAFDRHYAANNTFPADSYDANDRPLLSWRVHLLPALNKGDLYRRFRLSEPWDSPANRALLPEMPAEYTTSAARARAGGEQTYFRGFSGPGAMFERLPGARGADQPRGLTRAAVKGRAKLTVSVFEAGDPVAWTRPDQLTFRLDDLLPDGRLVLPPVGGISPQLPYFHALMADGFVKKIKRTISPGSFVMLIDRRREGLLLSDWEEP